MFTPMPLAHEIVFSRSKSSTSWMNQPVPLNDDAAANQARLPRVAPTFPRRCVSARISDASWGRCRVADGFKGDVKVLTSCPSCLRQGLARFNDDSGTEADYIVVEMAKPCSANRMADYVAKANTGGIERVLL